LWPVQDEFVRDCIHPHVKEYISPGELYIIETFNYFNAVAIQAFVDTFQWVGLWNLIDTHVSWNEDYFTKAYSYCIAGFAVLVISFSLQKIKDYSVDMEDSWKLGVPRSFGWRRKTKNFLKYCIGFVGFMFAWVGASNQWDVNEELMETYIMYAIFSTWILYLGTEILSIDALFYTVTVSTKQWRSYKGLTVDDEDESYMLDEME